MNIIFDKDKKPGREFENDESFEEEKISLDSLYDRKKEIDQLRLKVYQKILVRIHTKIKHTSRLKINEPYIFYVVPEFILGVPRYNVKHCTIYVIEKLEENGFVIKYTHPNMLFISWKHYIPSYQRDIIYNKYGVKVDGFGNELKSKKKKDEQMFLSNSDKRNDKKESYRDISSYKSGMGIYDDELIDLMK